MSDKELDSKRWDRLRRQVLIRDQYLDQIQKRFGRRVGATTVHHIFPREFFPEYTFEPWNLISVSTATHNTLHDRESHLLTAKGWDLLEKTARQNGVKYDESAHEVMVSRGNARHTRPGRR